MTQKYRVRLKLTLASIFAAWIIPVSSALALPQGTTPILLPNGEVTSGQFEYHDYCASCHGLSGKGDGPVAAALTRSPGDLTQLRKKHGGKFPSQRVYRTIDGRDRVPSHGTREMPVWGQVFRLRQGSLAGGGAPPLTDEEIKARIQPIVEYIKSLQK
ncbi:MAG: cytochrome c [Candidatus Binataceae bacterium]|jgi:mono/diheme cytochrome c family protein